MRVLYPRPPTGKSLFSLAARAEPTGRLWKDTRVCCHLCVRPMLRTFVVILGK